MLANQLCLSNNAFALIVRDENGYAEQMYPIPATMVEAIYGTAEELFLKFTYKNGKTGTFRYSDIIHLRQDYEGNDIFGENPAPALAQLMECVGYIDQGIVKAIKNSGIIRWLLKFTSSMRPEDVKTNVEQFVKNYLAIETDTFGAAGVDAKVDANRLKQRTMFRMRHRRTGSQTGFILSLTPTNILCSQIGMKISGQHIMRRKLNRLQYSLGKSLQQSSFHQEREAVEIT